MTKEEYFIELKKIINDVMKRIEKEGRSSKPIPTKYPKDAINEYYLNFGQKIKRQINLKHEELNKRRLKNLYRYIFKNLSETDEKYIFIEILKVYNGDEMIINSYSIHVFDSIMDAFTCQNLVKIYNPSYSNDKLHTKIHYSEIVILNKFYYTIINQKMHTIFDNVYSNDGHQYFHYTEDYEWMIEVLSKFGDINIDIYIH